MRHIILAILLVGCGSAPAEVKMCSVATASGEHTMTCPDGSYVSWRDGENGADGSQGPAGVVVLVSTVSEPAGLNCQKGGVKFEVGPDTNNNNVLDVDEISTTKYVCNGELLDTVDYTLDGSFTVNNSFDVAILSEYQHVTGSVIISPMTDMVIELPALLTVDVALYISGLITEVNMSGLSSVGSLLDVSGTSLSTLSNLGAAALSAESVNITDNPNLLQCQIDELLGRTTSFDVNVENNGGPC